MACLRISILEYKSVKLSLEFPAVARPDLGIRVTFSGERIRAHGISRAPSRSENSRAHSRTATMRDSYSREINGSSLAVQTEIVPLNTS